ncbi:sulfotransferase family protein [Nostocoides japonicum]
MRSRWGSAEGSLPDFLILGGMRCGTTSLYSYLADHPDVEPATGKELQYFTVFNSRGERWYRGHFPPPQAGRQTFEASPYYLYHPLAPARVAHTLPEARFIALLRDPVQRAYSHYKHSVERGVERLSFLDAIHAEPERLRPYLGGDVESRQAHLALRSYSYVSRGRYAEQLERWYQHVDRRRVLVLRSEDMYADPAAAFAKCLDFLGLARYTPTAFGVHTRAKPPMVTLDDEATAELRGAFASENERLISLLGWQRAWPISSART